MKNLKSIFFAKVLFLVLFIADAYPQTMTNLVTGTVKDRANNPVEFAVIKLYNAADSVLLTGTMSSKDGSFSLRTTAGGKFLLKISFVGFKAFSRQIHLVKEKPNLALGNLVLEEGIELKAVTIENEGPAIRVKQDTTEYNAAAFKTAPGAVVEDLIKKLPGLEVDNTGNITAQGEKITKVLVDGKEFFGNDPKIATKNLPADAIKSAQLIEEKTEQAKNSGVDDGKREKVLNLVLKADKKKGWFGSSSLAGGTRERHLGSLSFNRFIKDKQFNVLLLSNNVNQSGFTYEEAANFGGGQRNSSSMSYSNGVMTRTVNGVNVGNASQGLSETTSGGLNFSDAWGKKNGFKFSGSYFGSSSSTYQETTTTSMNTRTAGVFYSDGANQNDSDNQSHRINLRINARLDSLTNFSFVPSFSLSFSDRAGTYNSIQRNSSQQEINSSSGTSSNKSASPGFNGSLSLNRRFKKNNGTVSLYMYGNLNRNKYDNIQRTNNQYFQLNSQQVFNRLDTDERLYNNLSVSNTINRSMGKDKKTSVFLSNDFTSSDNNSNSDAYEYNSATGLYEITVDSLRNESQSRTHTYESGIGMSRNYKKWYFYLKSGFQFMTLNGDATTRNLPQNVSKSYFNVLPNLSITYRPKPATSLSLSSYGYANAPSISNLQLVQNNTNPLYIREGNPDLKSSQSYTTSIRFNSSDPKTGKYTNLSLSFNRTFNATSTRSDFDPATGIQRSKPVNVQGNYSLNLSGSYSIPTKIKDLRITPGLNVLSSRNQNFMDGLANNSDRTGAGGSLSLSYAYKDYLNVSLNNRTSYVYVKNSAQKSINNNYTTIDNSASLSVSPIKKWRIIADLTHRSYAGQSFVLLNSGIQRFFLPNDRIIAEMSGFDLLNRNSDVNRYVSSTYTSDTRSNNINQYFYLKLTYRMNKIGSPAKSTAPPPPTIISY